MEFNIKKTNVNPYTVYEGIYEISYKASPTDQVKATQKLNLEAFKGMTAAQKKSLASKIVAVVVLYNDQKSDHKARLSKILTLLGFSSNDVAKLSELSLEDKKEFWELTTKDAHIKSMGVSPHFTSCYRYGYEGTIQNFINTAGTTGMPYALIRQMTPEKKLRSRFLLLNHTTTNGHYMIQSSNMITTNVWRTNPAGLLASKADTVAKAFVDNKVRKLEGEELKNFKWE